MAKAATTGRNLSLVLCIFVVLSCLGSKLPTNTSYPLLNARMCCWHEADGKFIASWNLDINERKMLHFNSITGAMSILEPDAILLTEKLKKNVEVTAFLQMTSQSHCKTWFREFKSHWGKQHTGSSKAITIKPHISIMRILLTCSLLLLLSGGSLAMTG